MKTTLQMETEANHPSQPRPSTGRHLLVVCLLPLLMIAVLTGCKHNAKMQAREDPVGSYTLVSVDGRKVPCTVEHDGHTVDIRSGDFLINEDGTCVSRMNFSVPPGGGSTRDVKATYTREGSTLTMKWEGAGMTSGTVDGNIFTMNNEGMVLTYRK